jgi:hypothetical protein
MEYMVEKEPFRDDVFRALLRRAYTLESNDWFGCSANEAWGLFYTYMRIQGVAACSEFVSKRATYEDFVMFGMHMHRFCSVFGTLFCGDGDIFMDHVWEGFDKYKDRLGKTEIRQGMIDTEHDISMEDFDKRYHPEVHIYGPFRDYDPLA